MSLVSVQIQNPYFITMFITVIGMVLRSSPQVMVVKFDYNKDSAGDRLMLLELFEGSVVFKQVIIVLVFVMLVVSQFMILRHYQGLMIGEIVMRLLFPLQIYLAATLYNQQSYETGYLVIIILSVMLVETITGLFEYRFHCGKYSRNLSISKLYDILWEVNLLLPAFGSLFINEKSQLTVLIIILVMLNLLKSGLFASKITYETPVLQYCGYIGEFYSWMSVIQLSLFTFFNINPTLLQWIILVVSISLIFKPNQLIIALIEIKYMKEFKKQQSLENVIVSISSSIENLNKSNGAEKSMFTLMKKVSIVIFIQGELQMAENSKINRANIDGQQKPFFNFSQNFIHQVKKSKYMDGQKQNLYLGVQENQQQYLNIWLYIEKNPLLLAKKFYNFQRFLIYNLPIQNNLSHLRLVQLFYSWFNEMQTQSFATTQNSNSFIENIHRRLDYMYLRSRIDSQFTFEKKLIQNGIDTKRQILKDKQQKFYCLFQKEEKFFSWKFQEFFDQSEFEERIHKQMSAFCETESQLINLLASPEIQKKFHIFKHLMQRNRKKNRVFSIFDEYGISRRSIKCTIYEFMITKYILKLPKLATRELRQRMQAISKVNIQLLDEDKDKFNVVISGMREKGFLIHTCSMFKEKMEIKQLREDYKNSKRLHINELMMQYYSEKHLQTLEGLNYMSESMRNYHNTKHKGLFMASLVTQRLFQVSFTINFMTRSMNDIYLVMDITYKEVSSLIVYKNNSKVFQKKSPLLMRSLSTIEESSNESRIKISQKDRIISVDEKIFGEKYHFEYEYIDQRKYEEETQQKESEIQFVEEEQFDARLKETKEKDLQTYRKGKFFNQNSWLFFTICMFLIPVVLTILTYVLTHIATQKQQYNKNSYMINCIMQNEFFLTDLKSFNTFFAYLIFNSNYIIFQNTQQKVSFFNSWSFYTFQEFGNIDSRGITMIENLIQPNALTPFLFAPSALSESSFFYRQLRYDVQFKDIFSTFGNISTEQQFRQTGMISSAVPNQAQFAQLERFYTENFRDYQKYTSSGDSVFVSLEGVAETELDSQQNLFTNISITIIILCSVGGLGFTIIYMNLKFKVLEMVQKSFSLNESNIIKMRSRLGQFLELLKTSERSSSCTLVEKLGVVTNKKVKTDGKILSNSKMNRSDSIEQPEMNVLRHSWLQITIFLLIIVSFIMIIFSFNSNTAFQIDMINRYLQGTQELVQVTGKALYLFNSLIDGLESTNPIDPLIPTYIEEILSVDRVAILRKLFPSQKMLNQIIFEPMCTQHPQMQCYHNQFSKQTFMQTMSRITYLSGTLYGAMLRTGKFGKINQQPINELYNQMNLMTAMIRQVLQQVQTNFLSQLPYFLSYIYYVCGYLIAYFILMVMWSYTQTYRKCKVYSQEVLSLVTYDEMMKISDFHFYLKDIENQQWVENHQHY